ncbi:DUF7010 family protein [Neobacillus notoginsengisoli]|uniref:DUF7010 family protein n=1 Tax=Neobacillus notoginsengisoli TaxID=1578198 RepID=UPI003B848323
MWIYKSKAYIFLTLSMCLSSMLLGSIFLDSAFFIVPMAISLSFVASILKIFQELRTPIVPVDANA